MDNESVDNVYIYIIIGIDNIVNIVIDYQESRINGSSMNQRHPTSGDGRLHRL